MRAALLALFLAACELQPPPPAPSPASPSQPATPVPVAIADAGPTATVPTVPAPPALDAGAAPHDAMQVTPECVVTGAHIAEVLITSATDLSLKASYEQARDRIVRTTAEACTSQSWTAEAQHCFGTSKQKADLEACEKKYPTRGR